MRIHIQYNLFSNLGNNRNNRQIYGKRNRLCGPDDDGDDDDNDDDEQVTSQRTPVCVCS